jgi:hypothetical protein
LGKVLYENYTGLKWPSLFIGEWEEMARTVLSFLIVVDGEPRVKEKV